MSDIPPSFKRLERQGAVRRNVPYTPSPEESDSEKIKRLTQENNNLEQQNKNLQTQISSLNNEKYRLQEEISELNNSIKNLKEVVLEQLHVIMELTNQIKKIFFF